MKRKFYLTNFSTNYLFLVLEQRQQELLQLELKKLNHETKELNDRIHQVKSTISLAKNTIMNRYLENKIPLRTLAKMLCKSKGVKKEIYQELFAIQLMETNELITMDLLNEAIQNLEIDQIMAIMRKKNTIYREMAESRFDDLIYDVDQEVYLEYLKKRKDL